MDKREANEDCAPSAEVASPTAHPGCGVGREGGALIEACVQEAEELFWSGSYHCAEAVMLVIRRHFAPEMPESVVRLVSGLGNGSGVGCICGALSAASIALGMVLPEDKERVAQLTRDIHQWFKETYGAACCRALQKQEQEQGCRVSPGAVAGKIAELLLAL